MGLTLTEKILKAHLVDGEFVKGQEIGIRIDQTLTQDATGTMAYLEYEAMGVPRVRTEKSVAYIDHNTLQSGFENADDHRFIGSYPLTQADDLFDATENLDGFVRVSSCLKACAVNLSKMCNDLRILASGPKAGFGEITLPAMQNGSSIMPGKINPVIPEVVSQVAFHIIGHIYYIEIKSKQACM